MFATPGSGVGRFSGAVVDTGPQQRAARGNETDATQYQAIDHQLVVDSLLPQFGEGGAV
jgi:hypothetical protein